MKKVIECTCDDGACVARLLHGGGVSCSKCIIDNVETEDDCEKTVSSFDIDLSTEAFDVGFPMLNSLTGIPTISPLQTI